ncbi:MAG: aldo/keto reductase [Micromonosporaceae bacterium]
MRYTLLGNSGLRVSDVALGTMTFGTDWGWGASKSESAKQFELFAAAGGTFVDTANRYTNGSAESILGELVAADRDHFVIGTKYSLNMRQQCAARVPARLPGRGRLHPRWHVRPP